jgi:hypothetical protein
MWGKQSAPVIYYKRKLFFNLLGIHIYKYYKIKVIAKATTLTDGSYKTFLEEQPIA